MPFRVRAEVVQGSPATVLGYLQSKIAGVLTPVTAALLSSITYTVYQHGDGEPTPVDGQTGISIAPSSVVLDTPVTSAADPSWPARFTSGYNFQHELPAAAFPLGATLYEVQYTITLAAGGDPIAPPSLLLRTVPNRSA